MFRILTLKKHTPRWIILIIDLLISILSIVFAFLLRFNFDLKNSYFDTIHTVIIYIFLVRLILFLITRSYAGIIRYTGTRDTIRIILVITYSNLFYIISNYVLFFFITGEYIVPFSIILIDYFVSIFLMTSFRLTVKTIYAEANNLFKEVKHIIIYGIDENAITTKRVLTRNTETSYKVEAFIDPSGLGRKKQLDGIKFYKEDELRLIFKRTKIAELIITDKKISPSRKQEIIDVCLEYDVNVLTLPEVKDWINGELSYRQIRKINIEDLLERPQSI